MKVSYLYICVPVYQMIIMMEPYFYMCTCLPGDEALLTGIFVYLFVR